MMPGGIIVAIVNYCTPELVIDCLASLDAERADYPGLQVAVADNASPDGSGERIAGAIRDRGWNRWARVLLLPKNGGFAYGNNAVIREYSDVENQPRYVWLLNSDTVIRRGSLRPLVEFLERNPRAGIAGSRLEDPDGTPQHSAFRFHSMASEFESSAGIGIVSGLLRRWAVAPAIPDATTRFDWLSGASMLIRRDLLDDAGLFDEGYFLYYEETDLCLRAARKGWECWYVPESRVVHLVGASTRVTDRTQRPKRRASYWFDSRRRYFVKHYGRMYAAGVDAALAAGTALFVLRSKLLRRPAVYPEKFYYDLARHSVFFKATRL